MRLSSEAVDTLRQLRATQEFPTKFCGCHDPHWDKPRNAQGRPLAAGETSQGERLTGQEKTKRFGPSIWSK